MLTAAQQQLHAEAGNWLNRGRADFLARLLAAHVPCRQGELLEVGAGAGQNLPTLARFGDVDALEVSEAAQPLLAANPAIRTLYTSPLPGAQVDRCYDVVVALDVLEHIEDDDAAARWLVDHLKPGGLLIATVPAYQWLFSAHDRANEHFRRYTVGQLCDRVPPGMHILARGYFNMTLFPLALLSRALWSVRRRHAVADGGKKQSSDVPGGLGRIFLQILKWEAAIVPRMGGLPWGLTAFVCARKPGAR